MLATVPSAVLRGVIGQAVDVEVHVSQGIPGFTIVGLPDASCRESRDRVRAALLSSGFDWPDKRVTVNLAPTGLRKEGAGLDLAIAVALLVASEVLEEALVEDFAFVAELGLNGALRRVPGTLCMVEALNSPRVVVAEDSYAEARLSGDAEVRCAAETRGTRVVPARRDGVGHPAPGAAAGAGRSGGGSAGRARPAAGAPGPGDRRGRGPPPAHGRPARRRQDDARPAPPRAAPAAGAGHGQGRHPHLLRRRLRRAHQRAHLCAPVPGAAPQHHDGGPGRGRVAGAAAR